MFADNRDIHIWIVCPNILAKIAEPLQPFLSLPYYQGLQEKIPSLFFKSIRVVLRYLLSHYLNRPFSDILFSHEKHGKPYLPEFPLHFSLSHTEHCAVIALSTQYSLGVDIENIHRKVNTHRIVERFFSSSEKKSYHNAKDQKEAFFLGWTRKEAYIKALGQALLPYLSAFSVSLLPQDFPSQDLIYSQNSENNPPHWVKSFYLPEGYLVSLASQATDNLPPNIVYKSWTASL